MVLWFYNPSMIERMGFEKEGLGDWTIGSEWLGDRHVLDGLGLLDPSQISAAHERWIWKRLD